MTDLVIMDIDGTCSNADRRFAEAGPEPDRHDRETFGAWLNAVQNHESLSKDLPYLSMLVLISSALLSGKIVVYVTAREERYRTTTQRWLEKYGFPIAPLVMRPMGNYQSSADYKKDVIAELTLINPNGYFVHVVDDDPKGDIEPMCKEQGYQFYKAVKGQIE